MAPDPGYALATHPMAAPHLQIQRFFATDYPRTRFPLSTNEILVKHAAKQLEDHINGKVLNESEKSHSFLPQQRVYASKPNHHLRRTVKLDPVAEYFVYDLAYRNRAIFRKSTSQTRRTFGYRFAGGDPVSGAEAYAEFKGALAAMRAQFVHELSFDVAAYFNSIYHHDLVHWFREIAPKPEDVDAFGQFLGQINSSRSVDCLPHGLYPTKMIGNTFLRFVDSSARLKSKVMLRFMDDFYLFDDDQHALIGDFFQIQKLLGDKGLSVNPRKTRTPGAGDDSATTKIDTMKAELLQLRRVVITTYEDGESESGSDDDAPAAMTKKQRNYLIALLKEETISEEDAELVLRLMQPYAREVLAHLHTLIDRFPNLAKEIYRFCGGLSEKDKARVADIVLRYVASAKHPQEFMLFWLAKLVEDHLLTTAKAGELLVALYQCNAGTRISKAKILEIPENRFGMADLRDEHLKTGQSDWLSWSAAVGSRGQNPAARNYVLKGFCNGSEMNHIIGSCILALK